MKGYFLHNGNWTDKFNYDLGVAQEGVLKKYKALPAWEKGDLFRDLCEAQDEVLRVSDHINKMMQREGVMQQHYGLSFDGKQRPMKKKEIDHSSAWTALCIWEWLLTYEDEYPGYEAYRSGNGVMETRDRVLEIAIALDQVWLVFRELTGDNYDGAFDFEFVPMFLKLCTNTGTNNLDFNRVDAELSASFPDTEEGIKGAAKLLEKHWLEDGVW